MKKIHSFVLLLAFYMLPVFAFAAAPAGVPKTVDALYEVICKIANWFFGIVLLLALFIFLYGAIRFFVSEGNAPGVTQAKQLIKWAVVGVGVAILAKSFIFVVGDLLGVQHIGTFLKC